MDRKTRSGGGFVPITLDPPATPGREIRKVRLLKKSDHRKSAKLRPRTYKTAQPESPGRINALKQKLKSLHQQTVAAVGRNDHSAQGSLVAEATQLSAMIARAERLVTTLDRSGEP